MFGRCLLLRFSLDSEYTNIFNLKEELPAPKNDEERQLVQKLDIVAQKIKQVQSMGYQMSEEDLRPIYELIEEVKGVPMAAAILGFIFMMLGEHAAMHQVFNLAIEEHGPVPALVFYAALSLRKLGNLEASLEQLQRLIGAGAKHYLIYIMAAELQYELGQDRACVAMCNLAIYENKEEQLKPFVLMAHCFQKLSETEKMFECFQRIEKLRGPMALQRELGELYEQFGEMYEKVKSMTGQSHG